MIGWRQNPDPEGIRLTDVTASASGMYFNDEHPLLSPANLESIAPDFENYDWNAWSNSTAYVLGDIVEHSAARYRCILAHTGQTPPNSTYWAPYSPFTAWVKEKTEAGIIRAIQLWLDTKFKVKTAKNILERKQLFEVAANNAGLDVKYPRLVGFEFVPERSRGVVLSLDKVGVQLTQAQSLTLYLFSSDRSAPVETLAVSYTTPNSVQWFDLAWNLSGAGAYYVCYLQSSLGGQSMNGVNDHIARMSFWDYNIPGGYTHFPFGKHFRVAAFSVDSDASELWDIANNRYTLATNYGLNFRLNGRCDYTDFIVEQQDLFKSVIAKMVAADFLRIMAYNPEVNVNRHERNVDKTQVLYEIDGDSQGVRPGGISEQLKNAVHAITFDSEGLDRVCLPCKKNGVKYRTI